MKILLSATLVMLLAGCATRGAPQVEDDSNEFVEHFEFSPNDYWEPGSQRRIYGDFSTAGPDPITHFIYDQFERQPTSWEGPNGEAPMPFGGGPFGPWDPGGSSPDGWTIIEQERAPDLNEDDTHDFLAKLGNRAGLHITADEGFKLSGDVQIPRRSTARERVLEYLRKQCELQGFELKHDGDNVVISKRAGDGQSSRVVAADADGRYDAEFKDVDAAKAIMSVARVSQTDVSISLPREMPQKAGGRVTLSVRNATPHYILNEIARQAGLDIENIEGAYHFSLPEDE